MASDGVIREFLTLPNHHRLILLELNCLGCRDSVLPHLKTKLWLTQEHWTETLELLTSLAIDILNGATLSSGLLISEANKKKSPPPVFVHEGQSVRLAATIRSSDFNHGLRVLVGSQKKWLCSQKIVANVAIKNADHPDDFGSWKQELQATLGVQMESQTQEISRYFIKTNSN